MKIEPTSSVGLKGDVMTDCRMCTAFQTGQMGERRFCADHAAEAVRMYNAMPQLCGDP